MLDNVFCVIRVICGLFLYLDFDAVAMFFAETLASSEKISYLCTRFRNRLPEEATFPTDNVSYGRTQR